MAVTETEQTPEERFGEQGPNVGSFAVAVCLYALNDRIDSLDAELARLTDELRKLQGARR